MQRIKCKEKTENKKINASQMKNESERLLIN